MWYRVGLVAAGVLVLAVAAGLVCSRCCGDRGACA
jgi:hypothetical protein